ncbi:hypothetical protein ACXR8U_19955 [Methylobacterium radiotolerans]|jgi:hypothetical protein|uniref:hypothetical protein n=1 Tax=Methylobacterium TaxID=407 RepID=UPI0003F55DCC|nr:MULTISPECIES: hypothetical protein [Methylobacterium]GAN47412.1 hypothetical protein ME121_1420 [Methylobacterium sp. ME121]KZB98800.1 hypothetical protein AU375_04964 [Methylobacterium radiotolerans]MBN6822894.1 hypothetical protein [Methylobacterium organophilum]MDE3744676.1 hypothetical protein [Methylobacterium radiotolerans]OXE38294.1 hypothetical protein CCS92_30175 [Methylobacterium radiotolerans]
MRALMLSAVTYLADPAEPDAIDRLADTLSVLVSGVAGGLVGDAVIVAGRESEAVAAVAEATGATLVLHRGGNPYAAGAVAARRDWILCLEAGDVPAEGWIRTLDRFVGTARPETALGRLHRPAGGWLGRLVRRAETVAGARQARAGDVVRREALRAEGAFAGRLKVRPLIARIERA